MFRRLDRAGLLGRTCSASPLCFSFSHRFSSKQEVTQSDVTKSGQELAKRKNPRHDVYQYLHRKSNMEKMYVAYLTLRFERDNATIPLNDVVAKLSEWGFPADEELLAKIPTKRKSNHTKNYNTSCRLWHVNDVHGRSSGNVKMWGIHESSEFVTTSEFLVDTVTKHTTTESIKVPIDLLEKSLPSGFSAMCRMFGFTGVVGFLEKVKIPLLQLSDDKLSCYRTDALEMLAMRQNSQQFWQEKTRSVSVPGVVPVAPPPPKPLPMDAPQLGSQVRTHTTQKKKAAVKLGSHITKKSGSFFQHRLMMKKEASPEVGSKIGATAAETEQRALCTLLLPVIPSMYFAPLMEVAERIPQSTVQEIARLSRKPFPGHSPNETSHERAMVVFDFLMQSEILGNIEDHLISLRVLGSSPRDVFVRLVGKGIPFRNLDEFQDLTIHSDLAQEQVSSTMMMVCPEKKYFISKEIAAQIHAHLLGTNEGGARREFTVEQLKYIPKPEITFSLAKLDEFLPPELFLQIPVQGPATLLIFDRLPHLFEVNSQTYELRPRPIIGCDSDGNLLHFQHRNTPCPRLVRYFDSLTSPISHVQVTEALSLSLELELKYSVQSLHTFLMCHPSIAHYKTATEGGGEEGALITTPSVEHRDMILAHSDDKSEHEATRQRDRLLRKLLQDVAVVFKRNKSFQTAGVSIRDLRRVLKENGFSESFRFFTQVRNQFWVDEWERVGTYKLRHELYVDRNHAILLPGTVRESEVPEGYAKDNVVTIEDLLEQIARSCVQGVNETSVGGEPVFVSEMMITQSLSLSASVKAKWCGGVGKLVALVPEWFIVKESLQVGSSLIMYIGHMTEEEKARHRMRAEAKW